MGRAILIIGAGALAVGVIIYSLIECAQTEKYKVRSIPKGAWILVILLLPVIGAVLWLFFGRPKKEEPGNQPQRGRGPDDDHPAGRTSYDERNGGQGRRGRHTGRETSRQRLPRGWWEHRSRRRGGRPVGHR